MQALKEHHRLYFEDGKWVRFDQHDAASYTSSSIGMALSTEESEDSDLAESSIPNSVDSEDDDMILFDDFSEDIQGPPSKKNTLTIPSVSLITHTVFG